MYEIGQRYNKSIELENTVNGASQGYHMGIYGLVKEHEDQITKQEQLIQNEISDLMLLITKGVVSLKADPS